MVELRKRKAPAESQSSEKRAKGVEKARSKTKSKVPDKQAGTSSADTSPTGSIPSVGDTLSLDGFGGEIETNEGVKTTLKALVESSESGVVLFTYPRASTPGCTQQACLFRDGYENLTSTGLSIYGLSTDSPKANTTFKTKQHLPYSLLCDPKATLISALGFKKTPKGTIRGVAVVDKVGKILLLEKGGPAATVNAVHGLVAASSTQEAPKGTEKGRDGSPSGV